MGAVHARELIALLEPLANDHGLELVTVEVAGGHGGTVVRVFLDREGGIDIDTIAAANPWVSEALDAVPSLSGPYTLEVSSPGIERVLRTPRDFERFAGQRVTMRLSRPLDGHAKITGVLVGMSGDEIVVAGEGNEHRVPIDIVERARLKADLDAGGEGSGKQS
ncbi:MAG: ribosome maturation factor RimP [Coriobacteriia bacterium]|nr:ribosome maturation factor RimP [Coriobacteriia bacterium]